MTLTSMNSAARGRAGIGTGRVAALQGAPQAALSASLSALMSALMSAFALATPCWAAADGAASTAVTSNCEPMSSDQRLSLQQALARVDCHPVVRTARSALQGARADEITAGQRPNPTMTIGANSMGRGAIGAGRLMDKTFDHQARLDQLIERGGKRDLRLQAADRQIQAARLDLEQARRDARADIGAAFVDLHLARARSQALQHFIELSTRSLALVDARVAAGDAPAIDAARLRADDARLRSEAALATADSAAAAARLAVALGLGAKAPQPDDADLRLNLPAPPVQAEVERWLNDRAEVRAAQSRTDAAERLYRLALAQRTRDVSVGLQADRYPASAANPSGNGNTVSLTLSVPLFTAHAYEGEVARALADWQAQQDQQAQVREAARALIEQGRAQFEAARSRREWAETRLEPAAERLAQSAEAAYARGGISMLDLIEARRGLRAARLERLAAQAEDAKAALRWQSLDTDTP